MQQLEGSGTSSDDGCRHHDSRHHYGSASDQRNDAHSIRDRSCLSGRARWRRVLYATRRGYEEARNADLVARVHRAERHGWTHHPVLVAVSHRTTDSCLGCRPRASQRHGRGTKRHRLGPRHGRHG